jgi:DNA mismatch endonuclease (patch repair protein)
VSTRRRISAAIRTRVMRSIRSKDTKPELAVRRLLWALGSRYRLHAPDLPGRPDIVMRGNRIAILVHGCFWHQHEGCRLARVPSSRPDYWVKKLRRNHDRDQANMTALARIGWRVLVVWECETADTAQLGHRLQTFLTGVGWTRKNYGLRRVQSRHRAAAPVHIRRGFG